MKRLWLKKKLLIGLIVLAVALAGVGIAVPVMAQTANGNGSVNAYTGVYLDSPTLVRLAGVLGITPAELGSQLQTGKTLATLAQEKNVPTSALVDAVVAPYTEQLASRVKYGYITEQQSQTLLNNTWQYANSLLTQNMSIPSGYNNGYYGYCSGSCGGNYSQGYGWGMMGPGMMGGWGGYYNNQTPVPGSNPTTIPGGTNVPAQPWSGGKGWRMMGRGCW